MKSPYEKNFTDRGYIMNYQKPNILPFKKKEVLQFKVELHGITPLIWRRILVPADYNFWDLHVAIQDSMGWKDSHLHHFEIKAKGKSKMVHIGIPDFDRLEELQEVFPGWEIPVFTHFNDLGVEANYEYDYGDGWMHKVKLEGYIFREKDMKYPVCIGGERACPLEDCGGITGYHRVIETLADPKHFNHEEMKIWVGEDWDSENFNPEKIKFDDPYKRWKYAFLKP